MGAKFSIDKMVSFEKLLEEQINEHEEDIDGSIIKTWAINNKLISPHESGNFLYNYWTEDEKLHIVYLCLCGRVNNKLFIYILLLFNIGNIWSGNINKYTKSHKLPLASYYEFSEKLTTLLNWKPFNDCIFESELLKKLYETDNAVIMLKILNSIITNYFIDLNIKKYCVYIDEFIYKFLDIDKIRLINTEHKLLLNIVLLPLISKKSQKNAKCKILVNRLCLDENVFYEIFLYMRMNREYIVGYNKLFMMICSEFRDKFKNKCKSERFLSFVDAFILDIKYSDFVKIDLKLLELLYNYINVDNLLKLHVANNNMKSILRILEHMRKPSKNKINIILNNNWSEDDLILFHKYFMRYKNKKYMDNFKSFLINILSKCIIKKYCNFIKLIIEDFIENGIQDELPKVYNIINNHFNIDVVSVFIQHDPKYNPYIYLNDNNIKILHAQHPKYCYEKEEGVK
jgi:hypothetical protein